MENKRMQRQVSTRNTNDYEMSRRSRIQENQQRLQALGVKNLAKSLTSLVESDKTKKKKKKPTDTSEKDADYMSGSDFHLNAEEDNPEEAATQTNKKHKKYIAPMSMTRYKNLAQKRMSAPNVSRGLTSSESQSQKGQQIDTGRAIHSRVQESDQVQTRYDQPNSVKRGRLTATKRNLIAIDNDDDHGERDLRSDDNNEDLYDVENDDIEDIHMNEDIEEQATSEDDTKFDIPEAGEKWILQSFGRKVKNWRARVKEYYHDPSLSVKQQISSRPKQVQKKQWKKLVKYWNKEKTKSLSEKNKENRAKKKMIQRTGKKSYARKREELKTSLGHDPSRLDLFSACFSKDGNTKNDDTANAIDEMKRLSDNLPNGHSDKPGPDDIFSTVMGKDRNGDAGMFGLGVRASDVWGVIPSRSACHRENNELKSRCGELTSENEQLRAQLSEKNGSTNSSIVPPLTSQHSPVVTNEPPRLRVGDEVFLKSILNSTETVAKGWVRSLNPNDIVGGTEIGRGWCEVNVQVPTKRDEMLVRPYGLFATIEDCVGATIAWPCPFISVVRED
ncbi:transposase, Tnp1/En/Spm-like protein [Artemisia annua]|uniref:Transposase, Tnp1/En/Spm-like protein n=1 Tax=Artemisia annua TaxID=35608 RepID=A0A2U1KKD2_ARTAN|nr:transposase, Tnp1/En/Spm-like protein [Artemisia annua]